MELLLMSNSTNPGEAYLGWPATYIKDFLMSRDVSEVLFVPYAGVGLSHESLNASYDVYEQRVATVFQNMGCSLRSVHRFADPIEAVRNASCIAVGGGNTFHLVAMMHETDIMKVIRERVMGGTPFMGWSAGANVACPTLRTTNDMPIIQPASFECLNLVPFQINPHYLDANPAGHGGETRQQRIEEFMIINRDVPVVGLRESSLLELSGNSLILKGNRPMRLFRYASDPLEVEQGADLSYLLQP